MGPTEAIFPFLITSVGTISFQKKETQSSQFMPKAGVGVVNDGDTGMSVEVRGRADPGGGRLARTRCFCVWVFSVQARTACPSVPEAKQGLVGAVSVHTSPDEDPSQPGSLRL